MENYGSVKWAGQNCEQGKSFLSPDFSTIPTTNKGGGAHSNLVGSRSLPNLLSILIGAPDLYLWPQKSYHFHAAALSTASLCLKPVPIYQQRTQCWASGLPDTSLQSLCPSSWGLCATTSTPKDSLFLSMGHSVNVFSSVNCLLICCQILALNKARLLNLLILLSAEPLPPVSEETSILLWGSSPLSEAPWKVTPDLKAWISLWFT